MGEGKSGQPLPFLPDFLRFALISLMRDTITSMPEGEWREREGGEGCVERGLDVLDVRGVENE